MNLRVTNRNNFTLKDRYDGVDYFFKPNESVVIEEEAARHIFGYGATDKIPFLVRQGWCASSDKTDEGMNKLNKFKFEEGHAEFVATEEEIETKDAGLNEIKLKSNPTLVANQRLQPAT